MSKPCATRPMLSRGDDAVIRCLALSPAIDITYRIEEFKTETMHRPDGTWRQAGGKGANVARAAKALGAEVAITGIVGGVPGGWFQSLATREGLGTDLVEDPEHDTRLCITVTHDASAPTEIFERSEHFGPDSWRRLIEREGSAAADWTAIAGTIPQGIGHADLTRLCRAVSSRRRLALDITGPIARATIASGVGPYVVKVNREEAHELVQPGTGQRDEAVCAALARLSGADLTIVTHGRDGAMAYAQDGRSWRVGSGPAGPYPTGCGDSFMAALLVSLQRGDRIADALRWGAAAGSANARSQTAAAITEAGVRHALDQVTVVAG